MKFGIIFVLMVAIGSTGLFAAPSWLEVEKARMAYETRPEIVAEVVAALNAEIVRIERFPREHRLYWAVQNTLPILRTLIYNTQSSDPSIVYITLSAIRFTTDDISSRFR